MLCAAAVGQLGLDLGDALLVVVNLLLELGNLVVGGGELVVGLLDLCLKVVERITPGDGWPCGANANRHGAGECKRKDS